MTVEYISFEWVFDSVQAYFNVNGKETNIWIDKPNDILELMNFDNSNEEDIDNVIDDYFECFGEEYFVG